MVRAVHSVVPGRTRYRVPHLYRNPELKDHLEKHLLRAPEIISASARVLTGNLLVHYDPVCNQKRIAALVEEEALLFLTERKRSSPPPKPGGAVAEASSCVATRSKKVVRALDTFAGQSEENWHLMSAGAVLARQGSSPQRGLTPSQVEEHAKRFGPNLVPKTPPRSRCSILMDQFSSLPVILLCGASLASLATGGIIDGIAILAAIGINAAIGYVTESEAERTITSLQKVASPVALLQRDNELVEVPSEQVLPGDILVLKPGVYVPGDARLIQCSHLSTDESSLTGESLPVNKSSEQLTQEHLPLADRSNMVFAGTTVTGGQGKAVVVATGRFSEIGKVQALMTEASPPETVVERQLNHTGNHLVAVSTVTCVLVFLLGLARGHPFREILKNAVTLAVGAVPEGLSTVATTTLALGIKNMRKRKALVRNMDAVCTLGSIQAICLDKTGTITLNQMSVVRIFAGMRDIAVKDKRFFTGSSELDTSGPREIPLLMEISVLCNETEIDWSNGGPVLNGSATENALVQMAMDFGIDVARLRENNPRSKTSYRDEKRQYMSSSHEEGDRALYAVKGSPLEVLALCQYHVVDGQEIQLNEDDRDIIELENERLAGESLRLLGVAYGLANGDGTDEERSDLVWLGLIGMIDPIRDGVKKAIEAFHEAGLDTVMITGDQSATAYSVGECLGLNRGKPLRILESSHLAGTDPEVMKALCKDVNVFSRVSPSHKLQIVQALQGAGKIVAMTGDGINDGPALKAADVGIAMGHTGTDVAREVADVILEEDNLETLIVSLGDGRAVYGNIRKALHFLIATNFSEIVLTLVSTGAGMGAPLSTMQLLWINLISDIFPGLALAMEPPEPDVMKRPPRDPDTPIVGPRDYKKLGFESTVLALSAAAAYGYGVRRYGAGAQARTIAFQSLTSGQLLYALTCKSERRGLFTKGKRLGRNYYLDGAVAGSLGLQVLTSFVPWLRRLLGLSPLRFVDIAVTIAAAVLPLLVNEITKMATSSGEGQ